MVLKVAYVFHLLANNSVILQIKAKQKQKWM